jgi:hypothetical protein
MNDEEVARSIANLEQALAAQDAAFVRRLHHVERGDAVHVLLVGGLLAMGAVLLTTGLGTLSPVLWAIGVFTLVLAAVVDARYQRHQRHAH